MEHGQLVNDYHKVLRIIKAYSLAEIDSLLAAVSTYRNMVRATEPQHELDVKAVLPNGEVQIDSEPEDRQELNPPAH